MTTHPQPSWLLDRMAEEDAARRRLIARNYARGEEMHRQAVAASALRDQARRPARDLAGEAPPEAAPRYEQDDLFAAATGGGR